MYLMDWCGQGGGGGGLGKDGKILGAMKKGRFNSCHSAVVFFKCIGKHLELLNQMVMVGDVNVGGHFCNAGGMIVDFRS
jgi:hypothetical protein